MPRPTCSVWEHFLIVSEHDNKKHVTCNYCNAQYKYAQAYRLKEHLVKCKNCPKDIKKRIRLKTRKDVFSISLLSSSTVAETTCTSSLESTPRTLNISNTEIPVKKEKSREQLQDLEVTLNEDYDEAEMNDYQGVDATDDEQKLSFDDRGTQKTFFSTRPSERRRRNEESMVSEENTVQNENEFDLFCRSLAVQLKKMPLDRALMCQQKLQAVMTQERLKYINDSIGDPLENQR